MVGFITFKDARIISEGGVSYIRDHKSWIFAPSAIQVEASLDGKTYFVVAQKTLPTATASDKSPFKSEVIIQLDNDKNIKYKYLKYTISNPGQLPSWHLGVGNPTWLFVDELLFR